MESDKPAGHPIPRGRDGVGWCPAARWAERRPSHRYVSRPDRGNVCTGHSAAGGIAFEADVSGPVAAFNVLDGVVSDSGADKVVSSNVNATP
jgi:hypothetical protein